MSSKPPPLFPENCGYCRSLGKPFVGHTSATCPERSSLPPCPICGISGSFNHTASQKVVKLRIINQYNHLIPETNPFDYSQPDKSSNTIQKK